MTDTLDDRALAIALEGGTEELDPETADAVGRARADIAAIQSALREIADELPGPTQPVDRGRGRIRLWATVGVAIAAVVAIGAWRAHQPAPHTAATAHPAFLPDQFDYRGAGVGSREALPLIPYHVPGLNDIAASSSRNVWIVGSVAWHWDGSRWQRVALPALHQSSWVLDGVASRNPQTTWAVGSQAAPSDRMTTSRPLVERFAAGAWSVIQLRRPPAGGLIAVSEDKTGDVWAVGWQLDPGAGRDATRPLVMHRRGTSWAVIPFPRITGEASRVVALAPDDVWISGPAVYQTGTPFVARWNGRRWQRIPAPFGPRDPVAGLTATSPTDVWAVGSRLAGGHSRTLAAHWNGHRWQVAPTPNRNTDSALLDVNAVSPTNVWALGQSSYFRSHRPGHGGCHSGCEGETISTFPVAIYERWNGVRWTLAGAAPETMMFEGSASIAVAHDGSAWAAGGCYFDDVVTHWTGTAWVPARHPKDAPNGGPKPSAVNCRSKQGAN